MHRFSRRLFLGSWSVVAIATLLVPGGLTAVADEKIKAPRLEFRILANNRDEPKALEAAEKVFVNAKKDAKLKAELERRGQQGLPPMVVTLATDKAPGYTWVELGPLALHTFLLENEAAENKKNNYLWKRAETARKSGEALIFLDMYILYSRSCSATALSREERERKKFDYFVLTRDPRKGKAVTSRQLVRVQLGKERPPDLEGTKPTQLIDLEFSKEGGDLILELTRANLPTEEDGDSFRRQIAVLLDGKLLWAPTVNEPIHKDMQLSGTLTRKEAEAFVAAIRRDIPGRKK